MDKRRLGNSDLDITRIGIGAWAMGGSGWPFAWGNQDDADSVRAIHRALDLGMNWVDTAAAYGFGHSEEVVAKALTGLADRPYVFTKCSRIRGPGGEVVSCQKAESIRAECEGSLKRLKVEAIDLYQVHWPNPEEDIEEGWSTMAALQKEGKVRWIGVSNYNGDQLKRALAVAPVTSLQPPYSLLRREAEAEVLPFCRTQGIGVIVYSPMASGMLTGKMTRERIAGLPADDWRSRSPAFQEPRLSENLAVVERLASVSSRHGCSPAEAAIAWALHNPAVTGAIVGLRSPEQAEGVAGAASLVLSDADVARIEP